MSDPTRPAKQVCFVDMPFGRKTGPSFLGELDFDQIYQEAIKPAVESVGLVCIRGDEENSGGIIHRSMFARLILSEFVIADLTMNNPNVFYELGVRHAARPRTTIAIFETTSHLPFDVGLVRSIPYITTDGRLDSAAAVALKDGLIARLSLSLSQLTDPDSPIFQLLPEYQPPSAGPSVQSAIRNGLAQLSGLRDRIKRAFKKRDIAALKQIELLLGDVRTTDANLVVDLFNAYYALLAWNEVHSLYERMPVEAKDLPEVRINLAMGLARRGRSDEALALLDNTHERPGRNPRIIGMRGRIFMQLARRGDQDHLVYLERAADAFVMAFKLDPTDTYLGINALRALSGLDGSEHKELFTRILPVVEFAADRAQFIDSDNPWAIATLMELAILTGKPEEVQRTAGLLRTMSHSRFVVDSVRRELEQYVPRYEGTAMHDILSETLSSLQPDSSI